MPTSDQPESPPPDPEDDPFQRLLAEYLASIDRDGTLALEEFRKQHPEFASRLGRQLDRLVAHMAQRQDGLPATIGPYRVLRRFERGGMGEVYLAEQTKPFHRAVAVKVIKAGRESASLVARFAMEVQTLARLNHNGIAKVFEAGSDHGRPFFAMEYVPGKPITSYCAEERLDVEQRLRLFVEVCRAVEYAHRQGIIHRDLKPSNILAYGPRHEPVVKIIDFGLAKVVRPTVARDERLTETAQIVGTPDYMSPEQVDDSGKLVVDTRTDVYALGVVLYELLTGVLPLAVGQVGKHDLQAMIRVIRERQPSSPSARVEESGSDSETSPVTTGLLSPRRLRRLLEGDLDSIVMKALAKHAEQRYGSAAQLADDLVRYSRGEPVSSRRHTRGYVLRKFVGRNRLAVASAATIGVVALASLIAIDVIAVENQRNLERGNLFGLVHYLGQLRQRDAVPPAAREENLGDLREWLREFEGLLAHRPRLQACLDTPEDPGEVANPDDWASGSKAQRALREAAARTLEVLGLMTAPGAELDKVRLRIGWAEQVAAMTRDAYAAEWESVRREVREDGRFEGLDLKPQVGLIPLGRSGDSKLQEFAFPLPGCELPKRVDGRLVVEPTTCPVFVLLPGGEVWTGAQDEHAGRFRYDGMREADEESLRQVHLEPFFASRFEFTNWQWQQVDPGRQARNLSDRLTSPRQPVVGIGWSSLHHVVSAWGMRIPTAAEWEYLARGGTDTPYWCGATIATLEGNVNLHDASAARDPDVSAENEAVPWSDGFPVAAPVGAFPANPFLLHEVIGNVGEVVVHEDSREDVFLDLRGGSWHQGARFARATARIGWDGSPHDSIGFRPVVSVRR